MDMRKMARWMMAAALAAGMLATAGCGSDDTIGGELVDAVKGDDSKKASENLTGTWTGISGTGQGDTVVTMRDVDGMLSGTVKWWWGGKRDLVGTRDGNSVRCVLNQDDDWRLTLSSDRKKLTGYATKNDGGGYAVSLSR
jgi:hypothetical protein